MENIPDLSDSLDSATSEQQSERFRTASRIALGWVTALNRAGKDEPYDQALSVLAEKIIALYIDENNHFDEEKLNDVSGIGIEALEPSIALYNSLKRMGISAVGDLLPLSYEQIIKRGRNLGPRRIEELKTKLGAIGVTLPDK